MYKKLTGIAAARKLYKNGKTVYTLPCLVYQENIYNPPCKISGDFEKFVNSYKYYNCTGFTGNYLHFYTTD